MRSKEVEESYSTAVAALLLLWRDVDLDAKWKHTSVAHTHTHIPVLDRLGDVLTFRSLRPGSPLMWARPNSSVWEAERSPGGWLAQNKVTLEPSGLVLISSSRPPWSSAVTTALSDSVAPAEIEEIICSFAIASCSFSTTAASVSSPICACVAAEQLALRLLEGFCSHVREWKEPEAKRKKQLDSINI